MLEPGNSDVTIFGTVNSLEYIDRTEEYFPYKDTYDS